MGIIKLTIISKVTQQNKANMAFLLLGTSFLLRHTCLPRPSCCNWEITWKLKNNNNNKNLDLDTLKINIKGIQKQKVETLLVLWGNKLSALKGVDFTSEVEEKAKGRVMAAITGSDLLIKNLCFFAFKFYILELCGYAWTDYI